jgi:hypothetical protein
MCRIDWHHRTITPVFSASAKRIAPLTHTYACAFLGMQPNELFPAKKHLTTSEKTPPKSQRKFFFQKNCAHNHNSQVSRHPTAR